MRGQIVYWKIVGPDGPYRRRYSTRDEAIYVAQLAGYKRPKVRGYNAAGKIVVDEPENDR